MGTFHPPHDSRNGAALNGFSRRDASKIFLLHAKPAHHVSPQSHTRWNAAGSKVRFKHFAFSCLIGLTSLIRRILVRRVLSGPLDNASAIPSLIPATEELVSSLVTTTFVEVPGPSSTTVAVVTLTSKNLPTELSSSGSTEAPATPSTTPPKTSPIGAVARAIGGGAAALFLVATIVTFVLWRRRRRSYRRFSGDSSSAMRSVSNGVHTIHPNTSRCNPQRPIASEGAAAITIWVHQPSRNGSEC